MSVKRRVIAQTPPVAALRGGECVEREAFHEVAELGGVTLSQPQETVVEEELERDETRLAHAALAILVVGPALRDAARTVDEQAVIARHVVKGAERRAQEFRVRLLAVQLQLLKNRAEVSVGLSIEHFVATQDDRRVPVQERALVPRKVQVLPLARGGGKADEAVTESERRLAVGDEVEFPAVGKARPVAHDVVGRLARRLQRPLLAEQFPVADESLQDEAHLVKIPKRAQPRRGGEVADVAVLALRVDEDAGDFALARRHGRIAHVFREIDRAVQELPQSDEAIGRLLLAERSEERAL